MQMTETEIVRSYKESADPAGQIRILAQLNDCSPEEIAHIVGLPGVPKLKAGRKPKARSSAQPASDHQSPVQAVLKNLYQQMDELEIEIRQKEAKYKEIATAIKVLSDMEGTDGD